VTDNTSAEEPSGIQAETTHSDPVVPPPPFIPGTLASSPVYPQATPSAYAVASPAATPPPATSTSSAPTTSGTRGVGRRTVVMSAVLAAVLASASTVAVVTIETNSRTAPPAPTTAANLTSNTTSNDPTAVIARANASVVTIATSSQGTFGGGSSGVGSGIIVSSNGVILTNAHVVAGADQLTVQLPDGRQLPATVIQSDTAADLATIKVDATGLTAATLGDSSSVQVGERVYAIGSPLGEYSDTVTSGVLSATNRSITVSGERRGQSEDLTGLLQTDAAINPCNSGGPLIDGNGAVIGIVTAGSSNAQGIGFAIPINAAKNLIASSYA